MPTEKSSRCEKDLKNFARRVGAKIKFGPDNTAEITELDSIPDELFQMSLGLEFEVFLIKGAIKIEY